MLPSHIITEFDNHNNFKVVLQKFLYKDSFYSLDEYFELQKSLQFRMTWPDIRKNYTHAFISR
jgi:hypothetical protein